jgi:hypothetical protein
VSLDIGTLDAKYSNFQIVNLDDPTGPKIDVSATQIQNRTPEWTLTGTVEHAFQLANGATLTPQLGVYMQAAFEHRSGLGEGERHSLCNQDSYAKWRTRLTYEPAAGSWQASLFGYNITDEEILYRCAPGRSGQFNLWHSAPAQWGAEFTMRIGDNNYVQRVRLGAETARESAYCLCTEARPIGLVGPENLCVTLDFGLWVANS